MCIQFTALGTVIRVKSEKVILCHWVFGPHNAGARPRKVSLYFKAAMSPTLSSNAESNHIESFQLFMYLRQILPLTR